MDRSNQRPVHTIALIPGDGIGQEVVPAAARVLAALTTANLLVTPLQCIQLEAGWEVFQRTGAALPSATLAALGDCAGALFGAVSSPSGQVAGYSSPILAMRKALDLYANLRPVRSAPVAGSLPDIDLLIVRENTECLYVKDETIDAAGTRAVAQRVITREASTRIAVKAFQLARARAANRPARPGMVTIVHKANVLSVTDGLFRDAALAVASDFPDITVEEQLVDSMAYRLIREASRYDVIVAPNLYGDILSDEAAALVGGLGLAPSANVGEQFVLAEPVHGSAPDIAGRGIANPVATVRAAALLLDALGEADAAARVESAVLRVLSAGPRAQDLGGAASTEEITAAIIGEILVGKPDFAG